MTKPIDPIDLPVLVRRGNTDPATIRRSNMALGASPLERELLAVGHSYDQLDTSEPGDAELLARVVSRTLARDNLVPAQSGASAQRYATLAGPALASGVERLASFKRQVPEQGVPAAVTAHGVVAKLKFALALGAALSVTGGYFVWAASRHATTPAAAELTPLPSENRAAEPSVATHGEAMVPLPSTGETGVEAASAVSPSASADAANPPAAANSRELAASPKALFSEANLLRRQGNTARATSKYRQLQAQFARSTEAAVSHVILGRMLLQAGRAAEACSEFTSYGSRFPRGTLAAEALQGQITCARLTADRKLERRACEQLLMRFADSPYAAAAKDRCEGGR